VANEGVFQIDNDRFKGEWAIVKSTKPE
jgi:hypothetical protein